MKKIILFVSTLALITCFTSAAYAFDNVYPEEAYKMAATDSNVYILDVRTQAEWVWVGHPGPNKLEEGLELTGKIINIAYLVEHKGGKILNKHFLKDVEEFLEENPSVTLITMCRSGKRSAAAAELLEMAGYDVLNMVTGFEGGKDARGYRTVNGWANDGLPYSYDSSGQYTR